MSVKKRRSTSTRLFRLYNQRSRQWGERYMMRHFWRIRAMYDYEDVKQDAFLVFLRTYNRYPGLPEEDLFRIYKAGVVGRTHNRARECFPNSHALQEGLGQVVVDIADYQNAYSSPNEFLSCFEHFSDLIVKLPEELADVLRLLIEDFTGVSCIEQRRAKRLSGKDRLEPLTVALARRANLAPNRDLIEELANRLGVKQSVEE